MPTPPAPHVVIQTGLCRSNDRTDISTALLFQKMYHYKVRTHRYEIKVIFTRDSIPQDAGYIRYLGLYIATV